MSDEHNEFYKGEIIHSIAHALQRGGRALESLPKLLLKCIQEDLWVERDIQGQIIRYNRTEFRRFVEAPYPEGLSSSIETIEKLCSDNLELVDFLAAAKRGTVGRPPKAESKETHYNVMNKSIQGNSSEYALQRLRDSAPELHGRVIAGELSPNAAMVEAGFRKKKVAVNMQDVQSAFNTLVGHMDKDTLLELSAMLEEWSKSA